MHRFRAIASLLLGAFTLVGGVTVVVGNSLEKDQSPSSLVTSTQKPTVPAPAKKTSVPVETAQACPLTLPPLLAYEDTKLVNAAEISLNQQVVTAVLIFEAGGEGKKGMQGVLNILQNRSGGDPQYLYQEATRPHQFEVLSKVNVKKSAELAAFVARAQKHSRWNVASALVSLAYAGELPDITGGATHYYASSMNSAPNWAGKLKQTRAIGGHIFMRVPEGVCDPIARNAAKRKVAYALAHGDAPTFAQQ